MSLPTVAGMEPVYSGAGWALCGGDCLGVLGGFPAGSFGAVITDPPYSSGGAFRGDRVSPSTATKYQTTGTARSYPEFGGDTRDQRGYAHWSALWLEAARRATAAGGAVCVFTDWRQLPTTTDAIQAGGWSWRGIVPWEKGLAVRPDRGRFRNQCEYVVWGTNGGRPIAGECLPGFFSVGVQADKKHHTAGKPVEVMRGIVAIADPGTVILDPFAGSGSTGVAALLEGRRFIGIERETAYLEIAAERLHAAESGVAHPPKRSRNQAILFPPAGTP